MNFIKRLLGTSVSVEKRSEGFISLDGDKYRLDRAFKMVGLTFGENDTPEIMGKRLQEAGTKGYLREGLDVFGKPIKPGASLSFYQKARPKIWKLYQRNSEGRMMPIAETDLPEAEAIKWAQKQIKEIKNG